MEPDASVENSSSGEFVGAMSRNMLVRSIALRKQAT